MITPQQLLDRRVTVIVDSLTVTDLRVTFKICKTASKEPNTLELTITNLSRSTRASMQKKGSRIIVQAGYENTQATIFVGDARLIEHTKQGPDWVTKIQVGDGERAFQHARISECFGAGTKVAAVLNRVVEKLGLDKGNSTKELGGIVDQFVNGYTAHGRAANELDRILTSRGYEYSVQDGRLQILKPAQTNTDTVTILTPDTGLIGSPEFAASDKKGKQKTVLKLKSLLQPQIRPGCRLRVQSELVNGDFRAEKVEHEGDTAGQAWYTDVEAVPVT